MRRLAVELSASGHPVSPDAVYKWVAGRHAPRPEHAREISRISRGRVPVGKVYRG